MQELKRKFRTQLDMFGVSVKKQLRGWRDAKNSYWKVVGGARSFQVVLGGGNNR